MRDKAKQFERKFWQEHDPITTPIYRCMEAFVYKELLTCLFDLMEHFEGNEEVLEVLRDYSHVVAMAEGSSNHFYWNEIDKGGINLNESN